MWMTCTVNRMTGAETQDNLSTRTHQGLQDLRTSSTHLDVCICLKSGYCMIQLKLSSLECFGMSCMQLGMEFSDILKSQFWLQSYFAHIIDFSILGNSNCDLMLWWPTIWYLGIVFSHLLKEPGHFTNQALLGVLGHLAVVAIWEKVISQQWRVGKSLHNAVHKTCVS